MAEDRTLKQILKTKANLVTFFRIILLFLAIVLFPQFPAAASLTFMLSVVLDYIDGIIARMYNECTFFGECLDWLADISSSIVMFLWWSAYQPHLLIFFLFFILSELAFMVFDLSSKARYFTPILKSGTWITSILAITMNLKQPGYRCVGLGYINQIIFYLCGIARILHLITKHEAYYWFFLISLLPALSYTWMNMAYTKNILDNWTQKHNTQGEIEVTFSTKIIEHET